MEVGVEDATFFPDTSCILYSGSETEIDYCNININAVKD